LARVSATQYGETIWSELYPGSRPSVSCLQPAVLAFESSFDLAPKANDPKISFDLAAARRGLVFWRLDGGFGTDEKLHWLLGRGYQVIVKGFSGRRADNLARQVTRWNPYGDAWLGAVDCPVDFDRKVHAWVKRRVEKGQFQHSYYLTTFKLHSLAAQMALYDQRGATEIEQFRNDKQGLHLSARRKHGFLAQKALILLGDIAHNLLADFQARVLCGSPFSGYAAKRIVRDLFAIEGRLTWDGQQLARIEFCRTHPNAEAMVACLRRYFRAEKPPG
jgi:hypothetical protein